MVAADLLHVSVSRCAARPAHKTQHTVKHFCQSWLHVCAGPVTIGPLISGTHSNKLPVALLVVGLCQYLLITVLQPGPESHHINRESHSTQ